MKLNLGCGNDYIDGWTNVDKGDCRCDVQFDIESFPWPLEENTIDEILLKHIMEHVDPLNFYPFMKEIYRVCQDDAIVQIISPHAGSDNYWTDPTHKFPLTVRTFDFFDANKQLHENGLIYGWAKNIKFEVLRAQQVHNPPNGPDVFHVLKVIK